MGETRTRIELTGQHRSFSHPRGATSFSHQTLSYGRNHATCSC